MYHLYRCCCGLLYGEKPEEKTSFNQHPHNFCTQCDRAIKPYEVEDVCVSEDDYILTPKHHYHPNFLND